MRYLRGLLAAGAWLPLLAFPWPTSAQGPIEPLALPKVMTAADPAGAAVPTLADLIQLTLERNPTLAQAGMEIDVTRGRAVQAGLYPNPTVGVIGEEMGDPNGPGGFVTAPLVSQEIVTAGKLRLSRAVANLTVDRAGLALIRSRYDLFTTVRQGYFEVLATQRRVELLTKLLAVATDAVGKTQQLLEAKQVAELDLLPFQIERDRFAADLAAARRDLVAAWQRLTSTVGAPDLPYTGVQGSLEAVLPSYDFDHVRSYVVNEHPDVLSARAGVAQAELAVRREVVQRIPNVTVAAGYMRDNVSRADEWTFQVGMPIPLFNRNQGNIQAARAELGQAGQEIARAEFALINRLATAYGDYSAARERVDRYRTIRALAERTYQLARDAFKGGQFEFLRVLQAQRSAAEAELEYNRALMEAWRAASVIAGLGLEEHWPESILGPCTSLPGK